LLTVFVINMIKLCLP